MRFIAEPIDPDTALSLIQSVHWDYPFKTDYERYFLVSDYSGTLPINRRSLGVIIIVSVSGDVCESITMVKTDRRMLNYLDLVETLYKLPIREYRFGAERRLGNKYRFITQLMGGRTYENYDGFYYEIDAAAARRRFYMMVLKKLRGAYMKTCESIQTSLREQAQIILDEICSFTVKLSHISDENKQNIVSRFNQFIDEVQGGIHKILEDRVNEKNENCTGLLERDDNRQEINRYIQNILADAAAEYEKRLRDLSIETIAYLEYIKGKETEQKRFEALRAEYQLEGMRRIFYKSAPYEECFERLDLLYRFLNDDREFPKMKAESCKGCAEWNGEIFFCNLYQCGIAAIPFGCTRFKTPGKEWKTSAPASSKIQEKCGGCAFYIAGAASCRWLSAEIPETIAGCLHYKTVREYFPFCPACGKELLKTGTFCSWCGAEAYREKNIETPEDLIQYCTECGKLMNRGDIFCGYCGASAYYRKKHG